MLPLKYGQKIAFLSGGYGGGPPEDDLHFSILQDKISNLELLKPKSCGEWLDHIGSADVLVSGRFHHLVAAASRGARSVSLPGNTPKNHALCECLQLPPPIALQPDDFEERLVDAFNSAEPVNRKMRRSILRLAENNFAWRGGPSFA
ncbi:hypothetical protein [Methylobacterium durans]|uniref:hypothetical protein n=1 Tax=Methylobacterium durans TaxID=2202825 RepID=UPI0013A5A07E|nr:hypothetical protein [Methylobacterium durans]